MLTHILTNLLSPRYIGTYFTIRVKFDSSPENADEIELVYCHTEQLTSPTSLQGPSTPFSNQMKNLMSTTKALISILIQATESFYDDQKICII